MDELRKHPQIEELFETLDKNDMHKEKAEVQSLVDYIGDMEKTLTEMLKEMQGMRQEINLIHNNSIKAKCQSLVQKTEGKIRQGLSVVGKVKKNLITSAKNAVKTFKEKGKEAFRKAVRAMKVPETLDMLGKLFGKLSKEVAQDAAQLESIQSELNSAKGHLRKVGRLLRGKEAKESEHARSDKGIIGKLGRFLDKVGKSFGSLSHRAMDKADKIRFSHVKESVKDTLKDLKGVETGRARSNPSRDR